MSRVFAILVLIPASLAWNRVRALLTPDGMAQAARELGPALREDVLAGLASRLQAADVTDADFIAASVIFALLIAALGYFCDIMLERRGFGPFGNMGLLVAGASIGAAVWLLKAPEPFVSILSIAVFMAALGASFVLVGGALLRHLIWARFDDFAAGLPAASARRTPEARKSADVLRRRRR